MYDCCDNIHVEGTILKILIAEDEFTTRMMVQVCLENWGYNVTSVTNGQEAWLKLQNADAPIIHANFKLINPES